MHDVYKIHRSQLVISQDYSFDPVDKVNSIGVDYPLYKAGAITKPNFTGDWEAFWSAQLPRTTSRLGTTSSALPIR